MMQITIESSWKKNLEVEFQKEYFKNLIEFVRQEYRTGTVYPKGRNIFRAFDESPFDAVRVIILGQDPYHGSGQADGLCFSVPRGVSAPPSLRNIYTEIEKDLGVPKDFSQGDLGLWASQGVLLLNATLTVEAHKPGSHQRKGWEQFTDAVITILSQRKKNLVFMLWGSYARSKKTLINTLDHQVLEAPHPSPLSAHRGFFGSKHFSRANEYLKSFDLPTISW